jgi:pantoate--beta-alanine ligase
MIFFDKQTDLKDALSINRNSEKKIGFVPTMGALHEGHLALISEAKKENDVVVVSIFVNPTQFNNADDLKNYPRTFEADKAHLKKAGTDYLFFPSVEEMYPNGETENQNYRFGELENVMEGKHRPGHFKGVAQIVSKLFNIVNPDNAYFGEKDFQQLIIIRELVKKMNFLIKIIGCPTVREPDGLAMSSRNILLSTTERRKAPEISKALIFVRDHWQQFSVKEIQQKAIDKIESATGGRVEYLEIADEAKLQPVDTWDFSKPLRVFTAVKLGKVRLIDNISLNPKQTPIL